MPAGALSRSNRRPSRSSEETGSSNQLTALSPANTSASRSACLRVYAPLASTNSSAAAPIAARATRTRSGSRAGSLPTFIFTRPIPRSTHSASWRSRRASL